MERTVEVEFFAGPFSLTGQIDYPEGEGPFPAVLIVPGPPQHDRYGSVRGYKAYDNYLQVLADTILGTGHAVFRWDKGGTGSSSSGLSAPLNMVSAYRKMCGMEQVDLSRTSILAIAGGSAFVYRKWMELEDINPINNLTLLSTGVNELKLESLNLPICLIAGSGRMLRSARALDAYHDEKGHKVQYHEVEGANEQLFDERDGKVNLFNASDANWHPEALEQIRVWYEGFR